MIKQPKPRTAKGRRIYDAKQPQIHEGVKNALFLKGTSTSQTVTTALKDLYQLKRPNGVLFSRKNNLHPFDDIRPLEFFCEKSDAALFSFASHSKKRPNNLVMGRMFNKEIMDMCEFGVESSVAMSDIKGPKCSFGNRPLLVFHGDAFTTHPEMIHARSLLMDFFRGDEEDHVDLAGLEHVISITAVSPPSSNSTTTTQPKIFIRVHRVTLLKSDSNKLPRVELIEMGPRLDLVLRRSRWADDQKRKEAMRQPKEIKPKKVKNIEHDPIGDKFGRIHMGKQDLTKLQTRKMKGLKRSRDETEGGDDDASETEPGMKRVAPDSDMDDEE
ncbi:hypothetical protein SmJEL517_g04183 [Synchytrium microbalum]|uniref:Ribosome production factor 2 homolog n=1 Tax=Synchytrium microbalum TaxID=1806994 RepID=A0A507BZZ1_9FUNG|nr:uncharacterized protein SmJEL517_g04183 [Synchytrium microbalum]TPX32678.1 hypothetical protein SmJEL517_g04183 [Synchytrium microbalum]